MKLCKPSPTEAIQLGVPVLNDIGAGQLHQVVDAIGAVDHTRLFPLSKPGNPSAAALPEMTVIGCGSWMSLSWSFKPNAKLKKPLLLNRLSENWIGPRQSKEMLWWKSVSLIPTLHPDWVGV